MDPAKVKKMTSLHLLCAHPSLFTFAGLERVDATKGVGQGSPQTSDLVVLVVDSPFQVGHPVPQGLVFMLNHVICNEKVPHVQI